MSDKTRKGILWIGYMLLGIYGIGTGNEPAIATFVGCSLGISWYFWRKE